MNACSQAERIIGASGFIPALLINASSTPGNGIPGQLAKSQRAQCGIASGFIA
jgi:hypothetical protein